MCASGVGVEKDIIHAFSFHASGLGEICKSFLVVKCHVHNDSQQWLASTVRKGREGERPVVRKNKELSKSDEINGCENQGNLGLYSSEETEPGKEPGISRH